ncbi:MAG TPA: FAD-dependent oxidoreductase [Stellaceae bacterium]|nr:FAD-dependent oxidoreductase [Stellaceae bacterium]
MLIAGGGPCGLMLAIELGRRGVSVVLVDDKPGTAFNPQANATQARTMEYYRRLGFAAEVRFAGLPADYPTDIAYFTRFATHELARFHLPSAKDAHSRTSPHAQGWSASELPHRISQKFVEQILRRHAEGAGASVNYGWRLKDFTDDGTGIDATVEPVEGGPARAIRAQYLVGCDGPQSFVRRQLGYRYTGATGMVRDFMGGRMYAIYLRCPQFYQVVRHPKAWMHVTYNADRRAFMAAVDGQAQFAFHTQLRDNEDESQITEQDAQLMFARAVGRPVDVEILSRQSWTAGHALVAERFGRGRVLLGGDAAHLFTPAGGLGYNTAVEDAVNLGWKLAHVLRGQAPAALLATYEIERQHLARRNTGYARQLADSLGYEPAPACLEDDGAEGAAARERAGTHLSAHARMEFNIPGITLGGRYDHSPIIIGDGSLPSPDAMNRYEPTAIAGGRPPHAWLGPGQSLFDGFGFDWTLLRLGPKPADGRPFVAAAARMGLDLKVLDIADESLRQVYDRDLALIRPDQIIAWRGNNAEGAESVLTRAVGYGLE